jgi:hypothetical protein
MKMTDKQADKNRRKFLYGTLAGGAGVALTVAAPGIVVATAADESPDTGNNNKGYRLTQHIVDYYKTAAS